MPTAPFRVGAARIIPSGAPPPPCGPTNGPEWVRDNAGPDAVTDPGGGITFTTRADLQAKINGNPSGSIFIHAAGGTESYSAAGIACGTKVPKIYLLGLAGSTATTLDGGGANVQAFDSTAGSGFEVHGGTFTGFGDGTTDTASVNAIRANGACLIEDIVATVCRRGITLTADGDGTVIRRCNLHTNRRYGIGSGGSAGNKIVGYTIEHTIIDNNNTLQLNPGADSGGTKVVQGTNGLWRYNWVKDNWGYGIWLDSGNTGIIEENVCERNLRAGIFWENNYSGAIRHNALYDNGETEPGNTTDTRTQLLVNRSDGTLGDGTGILVNFNIIDGDDRLLVLSTPIGTTPCKAIAVEDNDLWLRTSAGRVGGDDRQTVKTMHAEATLTWARNHHHVVSEATEHWYWPTASLQSEQLSWAEWQAKGFDTAGTRVLI